MSEKNGESEYTEAALQTAAEIYKNSSLVSERPQELDSPVPVFKDGGADAVVVQHEMDHSEAAVSPVIVFYDSDGEEIDWLEWGDFGKARIPENKMECVLHPCSNEGYWFDYREGICDDCREQYMFMQVGRFGVVVPMETGVMWRQQTQGVMCAHKHIEGLFIPLRQPTEWDGDAGESVDLLSELASANYDHDSERRESLWERIDEQLSFQYEECSPPSDDYPKSQEALKWVEITHTKDDIYFWSTPGDDLNDRKIALMFPNSD